MTTVKTSKTSATVGGATYRYTAVFEPAEEGGYVVTVPALPGLHTEGDTVEEAQAMAEDAVRCYLEGCLQDDEEIPLEHGEPIIRPIAVTLAKG